MDAPPAIRLDDDRLQAALATFARDRSMWIDGRDDRGAGETIERLSPAHGALASRVPSGSAADANRAIACARKAFDEGSWPGRTGGNARAFY